MEITSELHGAKAPLQCGEMLTGCKLTLRVLFRIVARLLNEPGIKRFTLYCIIIIILSARSPNLKHLHSLIEWASTVLLIMDSKKRCLFVLKVLTAVATKRATIEFYTEVVRRKIFFGSSFSGRNVINSLKLAPISNIQGTIFLERLISFRSQIHQKKPGKQLRKL